MLGAAATLDAERGRGGPGRVRDGLIRFSVGLEDLEDLREDRAQAFRAS